MAGLDELFGEHRSKLAGPDGSTKRALAVAVDGDGDYALVMVDDVGGKRDVVVLGWLKGPEEASILSKMLSAIGDGNATPVENDPDDDVDGLIKEALSGV